MAIHTGNFKFSCEVSRKGFLHKTQQEIHMRNHMGLKYRCEMCGKAFSNPLHMKYHMSEHTGNYRFKCDLCTKGFN